MKTNRIQWVVTKVPKNHRDWLTSIPGCAVAEIQLGTLPMFSVKSAFDKADICWIEAVYSLDILRAIIKFIHENPTKSLVIYSDRRPNQCIQQYLNIISCNM